VTQLKTGRVKLAKIVAGSC